MRKEKCKFSKLKNGLYVKYGSQYWYKNDILHREDGPAIISDHYTAWYQYGELHREDGPAVIWKEDNQKSWYLKGTSFNKEEWWNLISDEMKLKMLFCKEDEYG